MKNRAQIIGVLFLFLFFGCARTSNHTDDEGEMAHRDLAMNFHRINSQLATGGHFTDDGVTAIAEQGVTLVVDLRDEPPEGQEQLLAAVGIRWVNVPVVWKEPKLADFEEFSRVMTENENENILVQCQANYRASAMTYAYRVARAGVPESEAREDLEAIWVPEGTWEAYVHEVLEVSD